MSNDLPEVDTTKVILNIERDRESLKLLNEIVAVGNEETIIKNIINSYGEAGINIPAARVEAALENSLNEDFSKLSIDPEFKNVSKGEQYFAGIVGGSVVAGTAATIIYTIAHFI